MEKPHQAYLYAALTVCLWSTVASAFKVTLRHLDYLQMLFYASAVSTASLLLIVASQGKLPLLRTFSRRDYVHSAILGFLNPFLYYTVLFKAYSLLPAQQAQPLNFTWPIMLVLLSIPLLGQKIVARNIVGCLVSFVGVLVISTQGKLWSLRVTSWTGASLAVGSSVIWALFWIYNVRDKRDEVAKLLLSFSFSLPPAFVVLVSFSTPTIHDIRGFAGAAYIGLFEMGITFVLWLKALTLSRNTAQVGRLVYLVPFLSLVLIRLVVGEQIQVSTIVGLILIVGGILLQRQRRVKDEGANTGK